MAGWTEDQLREALKQNPQLGQIENKVPGTGSVESVTASATTADSAVGGGAESTSADVTVRVGDPRVETGEIEFRSKTERRAWEQWRNWAHLVCESADRVARIEYEMLSFTNLPGGVSYKADIFIVDVDGRMHIIDVKGSAGWKKHYGSARSSVNAFKTVADLYPWFGSFYYLYPTKGEWTVDEVKDGKFRTRLVETP